MRQIILFFILLIIGSCAHDRDQDEPREDFEPKPLYDQIAARLPQFTEDGWIVSRNNDGEPQHQGDSLLWTGLAMASLPCESGTIYADRMHKMLVDNNGAIVRFEPLGEYAGGREISFDGATGLYFGILARIVNCKEDWASSWKLHTDYLERNHGFLHPNVTASLEPEFTVLPDYISHLLGQRGEPDKGRVERLVSELSLWVYAVKLKKEPCFRIHLAWLYARSLERIGKLTDRAKNLFCKSSQSTDMPIIDSWCGRKHISKWDFVVNQWEYRHQRCGSWETADGNGLLTPGVDLLMAYSEELL